MSGEHRIGEILVEMRACTPQELQAGLQTQSIFGGRLGTNLLELGIIDDRQLARALSTAHGVPCLQDGAEPEEEALAALTPEQIARFEVIPIHIDDRRLRVAVVDPRNLSSLDDLAFATGRRIEVMVVPEARHWALMRKHYGIERKLRGLDLADELEVAPRREAALGAGDERTRAISHDEALRLVASMEDPVVLSAVLVRGAASSVGRAVFLKTRGDRAVAWLGSGRLLDRDVRGAEVPLAGEETIFTAAQALRAPVLAPVTPSRSTAPFYQRLDGPLPMNAFVAPVVLRGRSVALLYADLGPGGTLRDEAGRLLALSTAVNRRFEALSPIAP